LGIANQTLHQTPDTWVVLAGAGGGAGELVVGNATSVASTNGSGEVPWVKPKVMETHPFYVLVVVLLAMGGNDEFSSTF